MGAPLGAAAVVLAGYRALDGGALRVALRDGCAGLLVPDESAYSGCIQNNLYGRMFQADGTPVSGDVTIAATIWYTEERGSIALLPDGGAIVVYLFGNRCAGWYRPRLRRIEPDFSVGPEVELESTDCAHVSVAALDDGTVLVFYLLAPPGVDGPACARRFSAAGQPLGGAIPINPSYRYGGYYYDPAVAHDGRFAVVGKDATDLWVHLYTPDGNPVDAPFHFPRPPTLASHDYGQADYGTVAYDDNGTIWIAWRAWEGYSSERWLTSLKPFTPGDMNGDGVVNNLDINGFVWALLTPEIYEQHYPGVPYRILGDFTGDNVLNNQDINGFVAALFGS